jgi:hypothetical protein
MGRLVDFGTVGADGLEGVVVGEDEEDVGLGGGALKGPGADGQEREQEEQASHAGRVCAEGGEDNRGVTGNWLQVNDGG